MPLIPPQPTPSRVSLPSPLTTLIPTLSPTQIAALPYPPDLYPGARDVSTPFGSMRVYELGPAEGRKVVLVHGDSNPSTIYKDVARGLMERGCRVMLFDLWGRGYTSTPQIPHTARLFGLQFLYAASSSSLPWTVDGFSIVAFSLGGGITMDFIASNPHFVKSVVLLAPVGTLRSLPDSYVRLQKAAREGKASEADMRDLVGAALEVSSLTAEQSPEAMATMSVTDWQFHTHQGHVASFASTVAHGPIQDQHEVWDKACGVLLSRLQEQKAAGQRVERPVLIGGDEDWVVPIAHVQEELEKRLGKENLVVNSVPGGHGFVAPQAGKIVEIISREWRL